MQKKLVFFLIQYSLVRGTELVQWCGDFQKIGSVGLVEKNGKFLTKQMLRCRPLHTVTDKC